MKKTAAVVVAVLLGVVAIAGAASYWLGIRARQTYEALLRQIGRDAGFTVTNLRFQSGLLSSTAVATIAVPGLPADISVVSHIRPGPLPDLTRLGFMPGMAMVTTRLTVISPALASFKPITAHTMIYLAGNSVTNLNIPAYKQIGPHGGGFGWGLATGKIVVGADQETVNGNIDCPLAQLAGPKNSVSLSQVTFNWMRRPGVSGLGESSLSVGRISRPGPAGPVGIEGLRITLSKQHQAGDVAAHFAMHVRMVSDGNSSYGPGQLLVQISKLDSASLAGFQRSTQMLVRQHLPANRMSAELLARTAGLLRALARKAPELEIARFGLKMDGSEVAGKGKFVLNGTDIGGSGYSELLLRAMNGTAELLVPRAVVADVATDEIHRRLDAYRTQGTLTPDEVSRLTPSRVARIVHSALPAYMAQIASRWHLASAGADYMLTVAIHQGQLLINGQAENSEQATH